MKIIKISLIVFLLILIGYQVKSYDRIRENNGNAPIISSDVDEIQISCKYEKEDLLQGLSAYDPEDGYITEKILIGAFSDFTERGISSLEYAVYDKDGNISTYNRKVIFNDYSPPKIELIEPCVFKPTNDANSIPSLQLKGVDMLDGDITRHILITDADIDFSKPGKYTASVYLKNSFGDDVSMDIPVHILEPGQYGYEIELKDPLIYIDKGADGSPRSYIAAIKNEYTGKVITDKEYKLTTNSSVDTSKDGIYEIQYSVISSDKSQRGETWLTVVVGDYGD